MSTYPTDLAALTGTGSHHLIFDAIAGSHAYGTATAASDEDHRGVFVLPAAAYMSLTRPPTQIADARNDIVYYSLARFLELAAEGNPNILELLWMPADCVQHKSPCMSALLAARESFITRDCVDAHIGYALAQIKRARGRNKWVNNPQPETPPAKEDFCWIIPAASEGMPYRPQPLAATGIDLRHYHVSAVEHGQDLYRLYEYGSSARGVFRSDNLVCESIPKEDETTRCRGLLLYYATGWDRAMKDHRNYWEWRANRNDARWQAQEVGDLDYDAKNMMHTFRLLLTGLGLVQERQLRVRFEGANRDFLLAIRAGEFSYDELIRRADALTADVQTALTAADLPGRPAPQFIDTLLRQITDQWEQLHA